MTETVLPYSCDTGAVTWRTEDKLKRTHANTKKMFCCPFKLTCSGSPVGTFIPTNLQQFTSLLWSEFCSLLGAAVSLSTRFHPQSNEQTHPGLSNLTSHLFQCSSGYQTQLFPEQERRGQRFVSPGLHSSLLVHL